MRYRPAQPVAVVVSLLAGCWAVLVASRLVEALGGQPPASVLLAGGSGVVVAAVVYSLLHDGPRSAPAYAWVRSRRGRR